MEINPVGLNILIGILILVITIMLIFIQSMKESKNEN